MFYFQSGQIGHSTNTIILKSNEHKSHACVFGVICTFQSSQIFSRLSMHFGVVDHVRASELPTADRRPPSWNRITDSTHAPPVGNMGGWTPLTLLVQMRTIATRTCILHIGSNDLFKQHNSVMDVARGIIEFVLTLRYNYVGHKVAVLQIYTGCPLPRKSGMKWIQCGLTSATMN